MIRFDIDPFIESAKILVESDETEKALKLLDLLPAYYRDNVPRETIDLKNKILSRITLPHDLLSDSRELPKSDEWSVKFLNATARGMALKQAVKSYNDKGIEPLVIDMGPGDFTFAIGLHVEGFKFKYKPYTLNKDAEYSVYLRLGDKYTKYDLPIPTIFVAYEIIEHLHNPHEIRQCFNRSLNKPLNVLLSTPKYTYEKGTPDWETDGIHHLRAYTPSEFQAVCVEMFPEYNFGFMDSDVMVMIGTLK